MASILRAELIDALFFFTPGTATAADPAMTFKLVGINSAAGAKFQTRMQEARAKVRA